MEMADAFGFLAALVASVVLAIVLAYTARITALRVALNLWSAGYALNGARLVVYAFVGFAPPTGMAFFLAEWLQVLQALALLGGVLAFIGRPLSLAKDGLAAVVGAGLLVAAVTLSGAEGVLRAAPTYAVAGACLLTAGILVMRRRAGERAAGFAFTAAVLILWGVHKLDFILLPPDSTGIAHVRFAVSAGLYTAAAVGFIIMALGVFHRRLAQSLAEDEARFRQLFDEAPVAYQSLDEAGRLVAVNGRWLDLMGYPADEVIGRSFGDFLSPSSRPSFPPRFAAFKEAGAVSGVEFELLRKDGRQIVGSFVGRINRGGAARPLRTHCVLSDVTEQRRNEARLTRLGRIFDQTFNEIFVFDAETLRFLDANKGGIANSGYTLEELRQRTPLDFGPEFSREGFERRVASLRNGETDLLSFEIAFQRRDGSIYEADVRLQLMSEETPPVFVAVVQDISARKRAEAARRESESLLQAVMDNAPAEITLKDPDGRYLLANQAYLRRKGLGAGDVLGRTIFEFAVEAEACEIHEQDEEVLQSGQPRNFEVVRRLPDGGTGTYAVVRFPLFDDGGRVAGVGVISIDVSRQKAAERALRDNEERLRLVLEAAGEGIYAIDTDGKCLLCNPAAARILGYDDPADLLGKDTHSLLHHSYVDGRPYPRSECRAHHSMKRQVPVYVDDEVFWRRDGRPISVEFRANPVTRHDQVVGTVISFSDITERKRTEAWLLRLSQSIEQSPFGIAIADAEGRFEYVNPSFSQETGYRLPDVVGKPMSIQNADGPGSPSDRAIIETVRGGGVWRGEVKNRRKDGSTYWVSLLTSPIRDRSGETVAFVCISEDITERRRMAEHLRQAQKMEAVGQLTGGIAHDFNNILAVILTSAECLAEDMADAPSAPLVAAIIRSVHRATELTDRLMSFSRRQDLTPEILDLGSVLGEMADMLRRTLGETIVVSIEAADGVPPVVADRGQFENAILNLAVNARDAMPEGGVLTLGIGSARPPRTDAEADGRDFVCVSVTDTGAGMSPEVVERVFEPFFTTKRKGQGTGLGLSMVYGFARQSGGDIAVDSVPGQGTTFRLYLPMAKGTESQPSVARRKAPPGGPMAPLDIVLAEDDDGVRTATQVILQGAGHRVVAATNGVEALDVLKGMAHVDLLVTDVVMPGGLSGRDLADAAAALLPGLKVLFTSGYSAGYLAGGDIVAGRTAFVPKPYTKEELLGAIRTLGFDGEG